MIKPKLSDFSITLAACNIPDEYMESRFSTKIRDIFEPAPLNINELLPDSFFNWDKIGIK